MSVEQVYLYWKFQRQGQYDVSAYLFNDAIGSANRLERSREMRDFSEFATSSPSPDAQGHFLATPMLEHEDLL